MQTCPAYQGYVTSFARRIKLDYHIDIEHERLNAPTILDNPFLSLSEIWEYVVKKKGLSSYLAKEFAKKNSNLILPILHKNQSGKYYLNTQKASESRLLSSVICTTQLLSC